MPKSTSNRMGHGLEVGFCDSNGHGFSTKQPADHIERWSLPSDNGTHLVIPWRPHSKACGRNVTSYDVDVTTSASFLNFFVNAFGSFPQDMCDPQGSKASAATSASAPTCSAYEKGCEKNERLATFIVPRALRKLTLLDVEVTVRAYGSLAPLGKPQEKGERVVHWCHKYRKARDFEKLRPWRNRALPQDSESLIQRAYLEHHRRMTRLEPGFLLLSVLVYCFFRKRQEVDGRRSGEAVARRRGAVLVRAAGAVGAHRGPGAGRAGAASTRTGAGGPGADSSQPVAESRRRGSEPAS